MAQPASLENPTSVDTTSGAGEREAKPDFGPQASLQSSTGGKFYSNSRLSTIFASILDEADRYRKKFMPEWEKSYRQYHGDVIQPNKAEWQASIHVPKAKIAVDTSAARIMAGLFSTDDFFDILPSLRVDDWKVQRAKNMTKWQWQKSQATASVETSVKDALICGNGPMKIYVDERIEKRIRTAPKLKEDDFGNSYSVKEFHDEDVLVKRLCLDPIAPPDFWLDHTGRGRFVIHRVKRQLSDLWAMAKTQTDVDGNKLPPIYDINEVGKIGPGGSDQQFDNNVAVIRRDTPQLQYDMAVDVYEYWGDIYDPSNGVTLFRNVVATFVNKIFCVRRPQANPFFHKKAPFIVFMPEEQPHQVYGYGILAQGQRIQDGIDQQANVISDKIILGVPTMEVRADVCRNPETLTGDKVKFLPGAIFQVKPSQPPDKKIFTPVTGILPPTEFDFQWYDKLGQMYDMTTNVPQWATGQQTSSNRKTKEEVQVMSAATEQGFNAIAAHIEQNAMTPLLKMVYWLIVQYMDEYSDDNLLRMFEDPMAQQQIQQLKTMSPEERFDELYLDAEFRVNAITLAATRQDTINRLTGLMKIFQSNPTLMALIDWVSVAEDLRLAFAAPKTFVVANANDILQQAQQAQIQQMQNPQQGQPNPATQGQNNFNQMQQASGQLTGQPPQ